MHFYQYHSWTQNASTVAFMQVGRIILGFYAKFCIFYNSGSTVIDAGQLHIMGKKFIYRSPTVSYRSAKFSPT